jgi:hypothetical protein
LRHFPEWARIRHGWGCSIRKAGSGLWGIAGGAFWRSARPAGILSSCPNKVGPSGAFFGMRV